MIKMIVKYECRSCQSENIVKNGRNVCGNQQYRCKDCGACKVLGPTVPYSDGRKEEIMRAYQERSSLRGISRTFGVSRPTVTVWLKKTLRLPEVADGLLPARADDVLELDEACGYVGKRGNKRWAWTALCRRTRQVVAFVNGDRSEAACRALWGRIPKDCRGCRTFSDFWKAYANVLSEGCHQSVGKETGETAHRERWDNTLRQRVGRMARKTLSISKRTMWHDGIVHWFVVTYNSSLSVNV